MGLCFGIGKKFSFSRSVFPSSYFSFKLFARQTSLADVYLASLPTCVHTNETKKAGEKSHTEERRKKKEERKRGRKEVAGLCGYKPTKVEPDGLYLISLYQGA